MANARKLEQRQQQKQPLSLLRIACPLSHPSHRPRDAAAAAAVIYPHIHARDIFTGRPLINVVVVVGIDRFVLLIKTSRVADIQSAP